MVYASVPAYLDPPDWNQQHQQQQQQQQYQAGGGSGGGGGDGTSGGGHHHQHQHQHQLLSSGPPTRQADGGGGSATIPGTLSASTIRPGSMADRARLAKVPQPEPALKCPRCDSTNTKFCYFNNYSLSQPRHFCKTCRRYWTRGGALRNVPVGGGCRRNKRSKSNTSSSSKSSASNNQQNGPSGMTTVGAVVPQMTTAAPSHIPFIGSLHQLSDYPGSGMNIGLNYGGLQSIGGDGVDYSHHHDQQWRLQQLQQFPFFAGLEQQQQQQVTGPSPSALGLYQFDGDGGVDHGGASYGGGQAHGKATAAGLITQLASVKMEESRSGQAQGLNLSRHYLGIPGNQDPYWSGTGGGGGGGDGGGNGATPSGGGWNELSSFNSAATGNLL